VDGASPPDLFDAGVTGIAPDVVHGTGSAADGRETAARQPDQLCAGVAGRHRLPCEGGNPPVMFKL